jgi:hypothetical protein
MDLARESCLGLTVEAPEGPLRAGDWAFVGFEGMDELMADQLGCGTS